MCAFNASHVRQVVTARNAAARVAAPRAPQTPFIEPRELTDGVHYFRIWPLDAVKNPIGYLYYATHDLWRKLNVDGSMEDLFSHVCPRTTNWDPVPQRMEPFRDMQGQPLYLPLQDTSGSAISGPSSQPQMQLQEYPIYQERCWDCEINEKLIDAGIESANDIGDIRLRNWLFGSPYVPGGQSQNGLFGNEKWHFPVTFKARIASSVPRASGKGYNVTYEPANELLHADLSMSQSKLKDELLRLIMEVPDCSHLTFGRWFRLEKRSGGVGAGGYQLSLEPHVSVAGFDIANLSYPNYSNWGKPNAKFQKVGKRFTYEQVEAVGGHPDAWWVPGLEALGVEVRDESAPQHTQVLR